MKKLLIICTLFLLGNSWSFAQSEARLSGKMTNPKGEYVYLTKTEMSDGNRTTINLDSSEVNAAGEFSLTAKIDKAVEATFRGGDEVATVYLEPGDDMFLTLNTSFFDETLQYSGKGSEKNNAAVTLYLLSESISGKLFSKMGMAKDTNGLFKAFDKSFEGYLDLLNDYKSEIPTFEKYATEMLESAAMERGQVRDYVASTIAFNAMTEGLKGKPAVDFEGINLEGEKTKLSDYKGKIIIVDFWATWCGPCIAEFPAYKELEEKYGEEVSFISVGLYCKEDQWRSMATDEGFKNNIYLSKDQEKQIAEYQVSFIPRYLIIDENFMIVDADGPRPSSGELPAFWGK